MLPAITKKVGQTVVFVSFGVCSAYIISKLISSLRTSSTMGATQSGNKSTKKPKTHVKARSLQYGGPQSGITRFNVPDKQVPWTTAFKDYKPTEYTLEKIKKKEVDWADPDDSHPDFKKIKWNVLEEGPNALDRRSFEGPNKMDGVRPRNPVGRTGLRGRGVLGRWGPNHAADPIVTRWKRSDGQTVVDPSSKKPILQFVAVQRKDTGEWAIPGGMVDAGRTVTATLQNEFSEEALDVLESNQHRKDEIMKKVTKFFKSGGKEVYKGYVDDPRNTDNAWMETVAMNFHDDEGTTMDQFELRAGDDAGNVKWEDISAKLNLYASHTEFIEKVAKMHEAHW